jgi:hypothetical protein
MSASITVSLQEFHRAAELAIQRSERTYPQFINGQSLAVASQATKLTEKADANRIAYEMAGNVRTKIRVSKMTGRKKAVRQYDVMEGSLAARIINARLVERGEKPIFGRELVKAARKMIGAKLRSVSFIRSGWIYAVRTLSAAVGYSAGSQAGNTARMMGQPKGYARPARTAISSMVTCEIANTALIEEGRTPMPVALNGLEAALRFVARDMMAHLAKKLQPEFNAVSAR